MGMKTKQHMKQGGKIVKRLGEEGARLRGRDKQGVFSWHLVSLFAYNLEHSESATRNACLGSTPWLLRISLECNMGIRMF